MFSAEGSEVIIALVWPKKQNFSVVRPSRMTIYFYLLRRHLDPINYFKREKEMW